MLFGGIAGYTAFHPAKGRFWQVINARLRSVPPPLSDLVDCLLHKDLCGFDRRWSAPRPFPSRLNATERGGRTKAAKPPKRPLG
ncbi:MAG: hypothetical protein CFK52_09205 [Chloracidobacterium sp. CP2_5A]|nr:MAG: hypothetical protein CFK52_09205 [Chloracidobacterium sp. CP2_5A]